MNTIEILEWMIKEYDKRGGGHSQKEALLEAINALNTRAVKRLNVDEVKETVKETWKNYYQVALDYKMHESELECCDEIATAICALKDKNGKPC